MVAKNTRGETAAEEQVIEFLLMGLNEAALPESWKSVDASTSGRIVVTDDNGVQRYFELRATQVTPEPGEMVLR